MKSAAIFSSVLNPIGFRRNSASWLRYQEPVLTRVSFYSSRYSDDVYVDIALTVCDGPVAKQRLGEWDTLERLDSIIPNGNLIAELIRNDLSPEDADRLKVLLEQEVVPLLVTLGSSRKALEIVEQGNWLRHQCFRAKLEARGCL